MKESLDRIRQLHDEGKISDQEYQKLLDSVEEKPLFRKLSLKILIYPHHYMSQMNALIVGALFILLFSFVASHAFVHFPGTLDFKIIDNRTSISIWYLLFQNILIILSLTLLFFFGAIIAKVKDKRIIDFLGAVALSRIPYFLGTLVLMLSAHFIPGIRYLAQMQEVKMSLAMIASIIIIVPFAIWQVVSYFASLKAASALEGAKLWLVFIPAIILSEAVTIYIHNKIIIPKMDISMVGKDKATQKAISFATNWLALMDIKSYSRCWDAGSVTFQAAISKRQWAETAKAKESYGKLIERKIFSTKNEGDFIRIIFKGSYERHETLFENVTLIKEDQEWRLSGYFIR